MLIIILIMITHCLATHTHTHNRWKSIKHTNRISFIHADARSYYLLIFGALHIMVLLHILRYRKTYKGWTLFLKFILRKSKIYFIFFCWTFYKKPKLSTPWVEMSKSEMLCNVSHEMYMSISYVKDIKEKDLKIRSRMRSRNPTNK